MMTPLSPFTRFTRRSRVPAGDTPAEATSVPRTMARARRRVRTGATATGGTATVGDRDPARLASLPYAAGLRVVADLLVALGYEDVRPTGRTGFRGRNRAGGYDLQAVAPPALTGGPGSGRRRRVVVQFKRYAPDAPVFRRQVDELRGACLRAGADEALLITTGAFSPTAEDLSWAPVAPVRLIDGRELAALLTRHGIASASAPAGVRGVRRAPSRAAAPTGTTGLVGPVVPSRPLEARGRIGPVAPVGPVASVHAVVNIVFGGAEDAAAPEVGGEARLG